jgi:hypothetical protein
MHYSVDETTGEVKFIGKEEITVDTKVTTKKSSSTKKVDENPEPIITLDSNKLILTQGAVDLLKVCEDCRIDIKYKKKDKKSIPVIGTDQAFKTKTGNKLTKSNTISFRGSANERLSAFGTEFKLEASPDEGIFYLIGNANPEEPEVPDDVIDLEKELDIESLDDMDLDTTNNFDFKL